MRSLNKAKGDEEEETERKAILGQEDAILGGAGSMMGILQIPVLVGTDEYGRGGPLS